MTPIQCIDNTEFACRATFLICAGFVMGFLIGAFVSDREAGDE